MIRYNNWTKTLRVYFTWYPSSHVYFFPISIFSCFQYHSHTEFVLREEAAEIEIDRGTYIYGDFVRVPGVRKIYTIFMEFFISFTSGLHSFTIGQKHS